MMEEKQMREKKIFPSQNSILFRLKANKKTNYLGSLR